MRPFTSHQPSLRSSVDNRFAQCLAHAAALQQVVVELAAPDAVADGFAVAGNYLGPVDEAGAEAADLLKHPSLAVFLRVDLQRSSTAGVIQPAHGLGRGNISLSSSSTSSPGLPQPSGTGRSGRAAADDQDFTGIHQGFPAGAVRWERVKGTRLLVGREKTTWNSCRSPMLKFAMQPER